MSDADRVRAEEYWYAGVNEVAIAAFTGLSRRTIQGFRQAGGGPLFMRIGGAIRYRRIDALIWMESKRFASTTEADAA
jgi:hypothetical protein